MAEEFHFESGIELLGLFPRNLCIAHVARGDAVLVITVGAVPEGKACSACIHCSIEGETTASAYLVVSYLTIRNFELQHAHSAAECIPEGFIADKIPKGP